MRHRKRTGKNGTRLAVLFLAIAKEKRIGCRIIMTHAACLPHKTSGNHRSVLNMRAARYDKIIAYHSISNMHRVGSIAIDCSVLQASGSFYLATIPDTDILDITRIDDAHPVHTLLSMPSSARLIKDDDGIMP